MPHCHDDEYDEPRDRGPLCAFPAAGGSCTVPDPSTWHRLAVHALGAAFTAASDGEDLTAFDDLEVRFAP